MVQHISTQQDARCVNTFTGLTMVVRVAWCAYVSVFSRVRLLQGAVKAPPTPAETPAGVSSTCGRSHALAVSNSGRMWNRLELIGMLRYVDNRSVQIDLRL